MIERAGESDLAPDKGTKRLVHRVREKSGRGTTACGPSRRSGLDPVVHAASTASAIPRRWARRDDGVPERLATEGNVAASTQNQALSALLFLYGTCSASSCRGWTARAGEAPGRLPACSPGARCGGCSRACDGSARLMARLLYGAGMRLMECLRAARQGHRLRDRQIMVRDGKGGKDRVTMLPATCVQPLQAHSAGCARLHSRRAGRLRRRSSCRTRWRASIRARARMGVAVRVSLGEPLARIRAAAALRRHHLIEAVLRAR